MRTRSQHDITTAIEGATARIRAYRHARQIYLLLKEMGEPEMTVTQPPPGTIIQPVKEGEVIKPEEVGTIDQGLTVIRPAPAVKPAVVPTRQPVVIRGMGDAASLIRKRLASVRDNFTGLGDDLSSLDKTLTDMRGHVNATHEDVAFDATTLGNSGNGGEASQKLADKLAGDSE